MPGKKTRAKDAVHAPGDPQPPPKPAPPPRTTHEPTRQVVDEYAKVVGVENVAGTGIQVLDCAVSVNEIKRLPAIPEDVCSVRERLQKLQHEKGEPLKYLLRVNLQAGPVALSKGVSSNFALGLYHWLSPAPMGIFLQLSAATLTALFAMMQRAQGPQKQYVSVYNVPDADREKEAGNRRMWSDPVKVKHWAEKLDTDTHIFFWECKFQDRSAYGAIQSVGRREALKGPAIRDLTQPTISVTQDDFFALGMGCPSPDIAMKYPVSRHPLPDPRSRTPDEYEATGYRLLEDILPGDLVDQLCALHLEGEENWEDILLQGHNQGGGRRQTAPGTVDKWLPSDIQWRLRRILGDLFPVLEDLVDREPRLGNAWTPSLGGATNGRTAISCLRCGVPRTRGWFSYPYRMIPQKNPCKLHQGRAMATTRPTRGM